MIQQVSENTKTEVMKKSAYNLPDRPSEAGISSSEIKRAFYMPLIDNENSVFAELDRVIQDINTELNSLAQRITLMETNLSTALENVGSALNTSVANIAVVQQMSQTVTSLASDIEELKSRCTALENE